MTRLEPQIVEETFDACLDTNGDVVAEGVVLRARLSRDRLADHAEVIAALLGELPDEFKMAGGGGWSFLNACNDRHGELWTGMHTTMDKLFMLGTGLGMVVCQLPREMWPALPGGMPYYIVKDRP